MCAHLPKFDNRDLWRRKWNDLEQNLIFYSKCTIYKGHNIRKQGSIRTVVSNFCSFLFERLQKAELFVLVLVCNLNI